MNASALRLALNLIPGLDKGAMAEAAGLVNRLYGWVERSEEPLTSYATGLLSALMEVNSVFLETANRERNNKLVPVLISRLRQWRKEEQEEKEKNRSAFKRPFSVFGEPSSSSGEHPPAAKVPRRLSREILEAEAEKRKSSDY